MLIFRMEKLWLKRTQQQRYGASQAIVKGSTSISSDVSFHKKKLGLAASAKEKEHFLVLCDILTSFSLLFILLNKTFEGHCLRSSSSSS